MQQRISISTGPEISPRAGAQDLAAFTGRSIATPQCSQNIPKIFRSCCQTSVIMAAGTGDLVFCLIMCKSCTCLLVQCNDVCYQIAGRLIHCPCRYDANFISIEASFAGVQQTAAACNRDLLAAMFSLEACPVFIEIGGCQLQTHSGYNTCSPTYEPCRHLHAHCGMRMAWHAYCV